MSGILERGAAAADDVASVLLQQRVQKALDPLKPRDFVVIMDRITRRLVGVTRSQEAKAIAAALDSLDVRWASMGPEAMDKVFRATNKVLAQRVSPIPAKVEAVLEVEGPKLSKSVRGSVVRTYKLEIDTDLSARNIEVERILRRTTINFVRDEMGNRVEALSDRARSIVARGMQTGLGSDQIGQNLREGLGGQVAKSPSYWRVVASSFSAHARAFGQVDSLDEAGIEELMFVSVLDEATTQICRHYHGKTWKTSTAIAHVEKLMKLDDPEEVGNVAPWVRHGADDDGEFLYVRRNGRNTRVANISNDGTVTSTKSDAQLTKMGIITPPLHGLCRSTLVPA